MAGLDERALAALDTIHDPCSVATRRPMSIVELGLLVDLDVGSRGDVRVMLRSTSPSCMLIGSIMQAVEDRLTEVDGVLTVQVELDPTSDWTPERMTPAGQAKLEAGRDQARRKLELSARRPVMTGRGGAFG